MKAVRKIFFIALLDRCMFLKNDKLWIAAKDVEKYEATNREPVKLLVTVLLVLPMLEYKWYH